MNYEIYLSQKLMLLQIGNF